MIINKKSIEKLIINGDLKIAIKNLLVLAEKFDLSLHSQLLQQAARYSSLQKEEIGGIINFEDKTKVRNEINFAVTILLSKAEETWEISSKIDNAKNNLLNENKTQENTTGNLELSDYVETKKTKISSGDINLVTNQKTKNVTGNISIGKKSKLKKTKLTTGNIINNENIE